MTVISDLWLRLRSLVVQWFGRSPRWAIVLPLAALCVLAFALRCLHLLRDDHYFIVSADSYYFHRMAELLALDKTYYYPTQDSILPIPMFSGITYPLGLLARGIAFLTPVSALDALEFASKALPPILGVLTLLVVYFAVSRLYGRFAALLSAFVWAILPVTVILQAAGYLDRDCLSILLVVGGVFLFYFLRDFRFSIGRREFGWVICAAGILAIEALLYISWGFVGPAILLAIIGTFFLLAGSNGLATRIMPAVLREEDPLRMVTVASTKAPKALIAALKESAYRPIALIFGISLLAVALRPGMLRSIYNYGMNALRGAASGQQTVAELGGIGYTDLLSYGPVLVPILFGLYIMARRRGQADLLLMAWFVILFLGGLFARRLFLYAAPAMCIISGIGFAALLDLGRRRPSLSTISLAFVDSGYLRSLLPYLRVGLAILLILLTIGIGGGVAYSFASTPPAAVDTDWYDALTWLRQNTPHETVVMTWWDYGYWILDVAHRVPVVDNGRHPEATDREIARVYTTTDDSEAVSIMREYGADYLLFSKVETRVLPSIAGRLGILLTEADVDTVPRELKDSLYNRSFSHDFHSDDGLQRVYPAAEVGEPEVVILALG